MPETFEASTVYCPSCDEDYTVAWSDKHENMFVVCGCDEAEPVTDFLDRFMDEHTAETQEDIRGYR